MKIQLIVYRSPTDWFTWSFTGVRLEIGRHPESQLAIAGEGCYLVSLRHAEIEQRGDTALITDARSTNGTYVNGKRIQCPTPVRAGDELWLGDKGPRVRIVALTMTPPPAPKSQPIAVSVPTAFSAPIVDPAVKLLVEMNRNQRQSTMLLVGLLLFGVIAAGAYSIFKPPSTGSLARVEVAPEVQVTAPTKSTESLSTTKQHAPPKPQPAAVEPAKPAAPKDPWQVAHESLRESLFLIVVEEPKSGSSWAIANATAVKSTQLLTAGVIGSELAKFQKKGFNVYALQKSLSERVLIASISVHAGVQIEQREEQIYFDLAILVASKPLPGKIATLATAAELATVEPGLSLASVAIDYGEDPLDRYQRLESQLLANKVIIVTQFSKEPDAPKLAHLRGKFTGKPVGCPIINQQGHLLGIYADCSSPEAEGGGLQVHYVPLIDAETIQLGLNGQPNSLWVVPAVPDSTSKK